MKKLVNSKVIDIDNIELFELGAEGIAMQNTTTSKTSDGIDQDMNSPIIQRYIKLYDVLLKAMPYPLYAIERDIKYATLANFIKYSIKNSSEQLEIWVNNGLFIKIERDTGMTLHLINNTWSIEYITKVMDDNTHIELFKDSVGYKEYKWVLERVINRENTKNFYSTFMPKFIEACNNEPMIINWELNNILSFSNIPNKVELKQNVIINPSENCEYSIDIFCNGVLKTGTKAITWDLTGDNDIVTTKDKTVRTYSFDSYTKKLNTTVKNTDKLTKCNLVGLQSVFDKLCEIKINNDMNRFPNFEAIMYDNYIAFLVDRKLFITKSNKLMEPLDIAHGVSIHSAENGKIYFTKTKKINSSINKETIYSYTLKNGSIRMCKVQFTN